MEISTKKHLYKLTINKKACGEVEIAAKCHEKELIFYGKIVGNYDDISDFEAENVLKGMEVLLDEKCRKNTNSDGEGIYRPQD